MKRSFVSVALFTFAALGLTAPDGALAQAKFGDAEFKCVSSKQKAAGKHCSALLKAWATWDVKQDDAKRDASITKANVKLDGAWTKAEAKSLAGGVDCVEQTFDAPALILSTESLVAAIAADINTGLDLGIKDEAKCGSKLIKAASGKCGALMKLASKNTKTAAKGGLGDKGPAGLTKASDKFSSAWAKAGTCPTTAVEGDVEASVDAVREDLVFRTSVAPGLDDSEFQPVSFDGLTDTVDYEGVTHTPRCAFDGDEDYHFFVKRGSVNKVVMYYQGGGACWENVTCNIPVCKDGADAAGDDPDLATSGFADLSNPDNPFRDWNIVFVTYCTCDIHYGDIDQTYSGALADIDVAHRGFSNAKVAEKFARENFINPDVVMVTGSSAGSYGALFHGAILPRVWPASDVNVLGDAGNGVITPDFLLDEFNNWNFQANLPTDIPGLLESITSGEGLPAYLEAVGEFFPDVSWANYSSAYDGSNGGQTGFYHIMVNDGNVLAPGALNWWESSCTFESLMRQQAVDVDAALATGPDNYRYYIGTGSRHTMYGSDKIYSDQTGGESQTIVDWVNDMLAYQPGASASGDWNNVSCVDCGLVLAGDPTPPVIPTAPFEAGVSPSGVIINCP